MSPDDIFAAQMWPWPDPMIKRDVMGRVLFINAAFLQLYGGRVEDWRGNVVSGWPAPLPNGEANRFETTIEGTDGPITFDWLEHYLHDGHALALARDVSAFLVPTDPSPGEAQTLPPVENPNEALRADNFIMQAPDQQRPDNIPTQVPHEPAVAQQRVQSEPVVDSFMPEMPIAPEMPIEAEVSEELTDNTQVPGTLTDLDSTLSKDDNDYITPEITAPPSTQTPSHDMVKTDDDEQKRDFERRALPVDESAVLGNNWRDAVIAKAVGAENLAASEDDAPVDTSEISDQPGDNKTESLRILLAEDNAINALLTRTLLEADGCIVDVVEDGALAVEAVKNSHYDMIFMDMRMPNMDGLESTRKIRALDHRSKGLPIVALTANAFDDDRNACFDSGMNDFMTKPVSAEELTEMVRTWTKNKEKRDTAAA